MEFFEDDPALRSDFLAKQLMLIVDADSEEILNLYDVPNRLNEELDVYPEGVVCLSMSSGVHIESHQKYPAFSFAWAGSKGTLTDDYIIQRSVVDTIMTIREFNLNDEGIKRAQILTIDPTEEELKTSREDVTIEARAALAGLERFTAQF